MIYMCYVLYVYAYIHVYMYTTPFTINVRRRLSMIAMKINKNSYIAQYTTLYLAHTNF